MWLKCDNELCIWTIFFSLYCVISSEKNKQRIIIRCKHLKHAAGGWDNANNPSTPNGNNVETGASASTIALEYGQTLGTSMKKLNK